MDRKIKELIQSRAKRLLPFLADFLTYTDGTDFERGQAYKFTYLLLRGPRQFLVQFRYGEMRLDREAIQNIYWEFRNDIPGTGQLLPEEEQIIAQHNLAAHDYEQCDNVRPTFKHQQHRQIGLLG